MSDREQLIQLEDRQTLCCPECGHSYLHQEKIDIGWRNEDQAIEHVISEHNKFTHEVVNTKLPTLNNGYGYRRSYVVIYFNCEACGDINKVLEIRQHKGNTIVSWVPKEQNPNWTLRLPQVA